MVRDISPMTQPVIGWAFSLMFLLIHQFLLCQTSCDIIMHAATHSTKGSGMQTHTVTGEAHVTNTLVATCTSHALHFNRAHVTEAGMRCMFTQLC